MSVTMTNIGKVLDLTGYTADQIMSLLSSSILAHFGGSISIYDQVSTTQTVFKVQVTARHMPFYFYLVAATGVIQASKIYRYWDALTHTGSGGIGEATNVSIYNSKLYLFVSQNMVYMHQAHSSYGALDSNCWGLLWAMPAYYPSVCAITTADAVAGSNVAIAVDNTDNFKVGMKVAFADIASGWGYGTIANIGTNSLTIATLSKNLSTGSSVCVPPNTLLVRTECRCLLHEYTLNGDDVSYSSMSVANVLPLINNGCFTTDGIAGGVATSPLAWDGTFGAAYHDIDAALCCGTTATINDFLARNTDGTVPISGTALNGDASTIIDASKSWTPSGLVGKYVGISGGTNYGNCRKVIANTATSITVDAAFPAAIDATSDYVIADILFRYVDVISSNRTVLRECW